jgi:hypothetical protein
VFRSRYLDWAANKSMDGRPKQLAMMLRRRVANARIDCAAPEPSLLSGAGSSERQPTTNPWRTADG